MISVLDRQIESGTNRAFRHKIVAKRGAAFTIMVES